MKPEIHPNYNLNVTATCVCGATYQVNSTAKSIRIEICSSCHPFLTGKQKLIDSEGRIERFKKKYAAAPAAPAKK